MKQINLQTEAALYVSEHDKTGVYAELPRGRYRIAEMEFNDWDTSNPIISRDQAKANAALVKASFNAFNRAGRALGVDATELAQSVDLATLIVAARETLTLMEDSDLAAHHCQCPLDVTGPVGSKGCSCIDLLAPLRSALSKIPKAKPTP